MLHASETHGCCEQHLVWYIHEQHSRYPRKQEQALSGHLLYALQVFRSQPFPWRPGEGLPRYHNTHPTRQIRHHSIWGQGNKKDVPEVCSSGVDKLLQQINMSHKDLNCAENAA
jgi:hypothetical protein